MRCVAGLVLFFVLYICLCKILRGYVQNTYGELAAADVIRKYHALVAVAAGAASLGACILPGVLLRRSQAAELREWQEWNG